jgi:hypothetical protein
VAPGVCTAGHVQPAGAYRADTIAAILSAMGAKLRSKERAARWAGRESMANEGLRKHVRRKNPRLIHAWQLQILSLKN